MKYLFLALACFWGYKTGVELAHGEYARAVIFLALDLLCLWRV